MLIPDLDELLQLKNQSKLLGIPNSIGSSGIGDYISIFHGQGMEFESSRPYVPGDDIRHIDWRVTARKNKPHVKLFRAESSRNVILLIDMSNYMWFGTRVTFKSMQAARAGALLAWCANCNGDRVGGMVNNQNIDIIPPQKTSKGILQLLHNLCASRKTDDNNQQIDKVVYDITKLSINNSLVFIISDLVLQMNDKLKQALSYLRQKSKVIALNVTDPADQSLPKIGAIGFQDFISKVVTVNTNDETFITEYKQYYLNKQMQLNKVCSALQIPIIELATNRNILSDLHSGLLNLRSKC